MSEATHSYIGIKPCGCVVAAVVDSPSMKQEASKALAEWVQGGLTIERVTHQEVRERFTVCECDEVQPALFK